MLAPAAAATPQPLAVAEAHADENRVESIQIYARNIPAHLHSAAEHHA